MNNATLTGKNNVPGLVSCTPNKFMIQSLTTTLNHKLFILISDLTHGIIETRFLYVSRQWFQPGHQGL